jgi:prepilin-type N-terminal cleavage/methylation domain-containing protein
MIRRSNRRRGFTLVELILVMIVIFTLATVVAPRFSDFFPSLQVRKSTEHLMAWARKARADAALTGTRQRLYLDQSQRKFWIENEPRPIKEPGKFAALAGAWAEEFLPQGVGIESIDKAESAPGSSSVRYVEFRPDGTSADATIILTSDHGDRQTLKIEGATSKITIEQTAEQP